MSNHLQWKKSGRSECGSYQASGRGAFYFHAGGTVNLGAEESAAENRAICQRHAWMIASQQAINYALMQLATAHKTGAAVLSHELRVDSSQVSRWKLGRAPVPADHCERIMHLCNVESVNPAMLRPDLNFWHDGAGELRWRKRPVIQGGAES